LRRVVIAERVGYVEPVLKLRNLDGDLGKPECLFCGKRHAR